MRWIVQYARGRNERSMAERLAAELIMASKGEGSSVKKREDTHRMAEANRAFAHYRW
jgi:small subunit ribosomal protein S7